MFSFRIHNFLRQNIPRSVHLRRTFLSQAYYCDEVWENRLNTPLLRKVNLDLLYFELDQRFQRTKQISAVDVDIFANATKDDLFIEELLDLVHKLRLSSETGNTLESTPHAVIRALLKSNKTDDLLRCLDDRLNYGLFLDDHTSNILMDHFWKSKNFTAGAFIAGQLMLQEDFRHPLSRSYSLLHCYNFLRNPGKWPEPIKPEEPEEEVKIRVKYLRNPYNDQHFDLTDGHKIIGKTLVAAAGNKNPVDISLRVTGLALFGNEQELKAELEACKGVELVREIIELIPEENEFSSLVKSLKSSSEDVQKILEDRVREQVDAMTEKDIASQCKIYEEWETQRTGALEEQKKQINIAERLAEVERIKASLKEREERLWFFDNEEKIELKIAEKETEPVNEEVKTSKLEEEEYVPPEIIVKRNQQ